ncbi:thiosulfate oxidation carrier protein SoxY [Vannielia sp.]|uniref:thiosulfate oxidation carrier protein SoxY n=1 Tax=Vannielia sp. TaxID=2813045 RepID=UPI00260284E7|nr:thiosulfate oxidation carrier protein SoxY [Vannielia sp.]MDF1872401.1 thiosulfate oxidation carrier protein SoxY [Vannielia sp.]
MKLSRRETLLLGAGAAVAAVLPLPTYADAVADAVAAFTGGADVADGGVTVDAPEIAENGNTVPISVSSDGAESIMVLATGNPTPAVATFTFGELAASQSGSIRIRLAQTQDVMAIAKMPDGTFQKASATVKVTIGGCGG